MARKAKARVQDVEKFLRSLTTQRDVVLTLTVTGKRGNRKGRVNVFIKGPHSSVYGEGSDTSPKRALQEAVNNFNQAFDDDWTEGFGR